MANENIRIFAISMNKQESESDLSYSQESESEVQTTDSPALFCIKGLKHVGESSGCCKSLSKTVSYLARSCMIKKNLRYF